jgi:hypothetical protein
MTLEEQFAQVAEKTNNVQTEVIRETAAYLKLIHRHFGKGSDVYSVTEHEDDCWEPPQKEIWKYLIETEEPKFLKLVELLEKVSDSSEVWGIYYHATYMASFCLLAQDGDEVDELLEKYNQCEECRETSVLWTAQWMISENPMDINAVSVLVHSGYSSSLYGLISEWVGYEADSWEFEETKYPNGFVPVARVK